MFGSTGNGKPVLIVDGTVAGTWSHRNTRSGVSVVVSIVDEPASRMHADIDEQFREIACLLASDGVTVRWTANQRRMAVGDHRPQVVTHRTVS